MPLLGPRLSTNQASKIHLKFKMEDSYNEFDVYSKKNYHKNKYQMKNISK